jgi:N-acetylneuraminate synthase
MNIAKELIKFSSEAVLTQLNFKSAPLMLFMSTIILQAIERVHGGDTQRAQKEGLEFSEEDYKEINNYCNELKIDWTASAWDLDSQSL